jgi:uncharacterized repeat protein (TIGR03943 family)
MSKYKKSSKVKLFESLVLISFAVLIFHYSSSGKLIYFVYPFYDIFILISAYILLALGLLSLGDFFRGEGEECENHEHPGHSHSSKRWIAMLVLLSLPILIGFLMTPRPLSDQTALARGANSELTIFSSVQPSFGIAPEERSILYWVQLLNYNPEPEAYSGQKVSVKGFIVVEDDFPENTFMISRFTLSCCAADARPIGLLVHYDPEQFLIPDDWVQVDGIMGELLIDEERRAVIELESLLSIEALVDPYVYK